MSFAQTILGILSNLENTFHPNELAYLAVTSKVEGPIRDRIAYGLHNQVGEGLLVHREWKDKHDRWTDISITDEQIRPQCLIELKAHSGPTFESGYSGKMRKDLHKLYMAGEEDTELYLIFLFNHIYHPGNIDVRYRYAIKYFALQNYASKKCGFVPDASIETQTHWEKHLTNNSLMTDKSQMGIRINGGQYYNMPVAVHVYLYGPIFRKELTRMFP